MNKRRGLGWGEYTYYRGQVGQWAQVFHRLTGLAIVAFLLLHIVDTALVGWGAGVYDLVTTIYHNPIARIFEVILVGVVVYHALNGVRVTIIDLWDKGSLYQVQLFWVVIGLFLILFVPSAYLMLASAF